MPRPCSVCNHPDRAAIDRGLSNGTGVITHLAAEYGVSDRALRRHRAGHLLPEMKERLGHERELQDVDVLAEMRYLYQRMKAYLERAEEADNWPAVRAFNSEARKDLELLARLLGELREGPNVSVLVSPEWEEVRGVVMAALSPYPEARRLVAESLLALEVG
jgi:hypothetical protein